jgi:hypothetical protein
MTENSEMNNGPAPGEKKAAVMIWIGTAEHQKCWRWDYERTCRAVAVAGQKSRRWGWLSDGFSQHETTRCPHAAPSQDLFSSKKAATGVGFGDGFPLVTLPRKGPWDRDGLRLMPRYGDLERSSDLRLVGACRSKETGTHGCPSSAPAFPLAGAVSFPRVRPALCMAWLA